MSGLSTINATYRLQFHQGFTFNDARAIVSYLHRLGISHIYASPIFKARSGSAHGYDVTDPTCLNPELGTSEEFDALAQELRAHEMGLLLDIVPNHMAASLENPWWVDVLENGQASTFAGYFDIDWNPTDGSAQNQIVLPVLGKPYNEVLENGELVLGLDQKGLKFSYYEHRLPLEIRAYALVLEHFTESLANHPSVNDRINASVAGLVALAGNLPHYHSTKNEDVPNRHQQAQTIKEQLWTLVESSPEVRQLFDQALARINGRPGEPDSFSILNQMLSQQPYRLTYWKTGGGQLNYRRFFDVTELAGVCVETPAVFDATHSLVFRLAQEGKINGLRLDHIDGLHDPAGYLQQLHSRLEQSQQSSGVMPYVVVEKILAHDEALPDDWPVAGTTGYDFLNAVNSVFVDSAGFQQLVDGYRSLTGVTESFSDVVYANKKRVISELFRPELGRLSRTLAQLAKSTESTSDVSQDSLTAALAEVAAALTVYRTYSQNGQVSDSDRDYVTRALDEAGRRNPDLEPPALDLVARALLGDWPGNDDISPDRREMWSDFVARWQQFTGPVMAKGAEDTALYNYLPLISLDEVGGDPTGGHSLVQAFHQQNLHRLAHWPATMNATSTHDTKRSEDVRARINVLSEIPDHWNSCLRRWTDWNRSQKTEINGQMIPEPNTELLVYQTLLGAWPLGREEVSQFTERLELYLVKAVREAKSYSNWIDPNEPYEASVVGFAKAILDGSANKGFLEDFQELQELVTYHGMLNSLSQVLLKTCSPGLPDTYQGMELWDFSLVDPDNRHPVDYVLRSAIWDTLDHSQPQANPSELSDLLGSWRDGRIKLFVTHVTLSLRRQRTELFSQGDYLPLLASGGKQEHLCAFARRLGGSWAIVAVPRLTTKLTEMHQPPLGSKAWGDSSLILPKESPKTWRNAFTGDTLSAPVQSDDLLLSEVFQKFPIALLVDCPDVD